jgi:FHA domain
MVLMTERREAARQPALTRRSRRRWLIAGGVAACWVVLWSVTGSAVGATLVLAVLAVVGVVGAAGLRALGIGRDHPWVQQLASRPWRDGQEVLQLALRHLPEVFVVTPSGSRLAPNAVELLLNPGDLRSLAERIDLDLIAESAAEVYQEQVAAQGARFAGPGPVQVHVTAGPAIPPGRYRLRQGQPVQAGSAGDYPLAFAPEFAPSGPQLAPSAPEFAPSGPQLAYAVPQPAYRGAAPEQEESPYREFEIHDGGTRAERAGVLTSGGPTERERRGGGVPVLRLVTGESVTETTTSGARAGRGDVELALPNVPTVSREHARFTYSGGQWWIANLGLNGLAVNGVAVAAECPLSSGDLIRWGTRRDALRSLVKIIPEAS